MKHPALDTSPSARLARRSALPAALVTAVLSACGGGSDGPAIPQLTAAQPGTLAQCASLTGYTYAGMAITSATPMAAGAVTSTADGVTLTLPAHCVVLGKMNPRTGIDGKPYAINFEMRLPNNWNGRFFHQVNGGNDGAINSDTTRAFGRKTGGSPTSNGLIEGFAVLSSDAGHAPDTSYANDPATGMGISGQVFGLDPQARKDYGYAAVGTLTPMAKGLINAAYGRGPDRSYMVGCSNGGRHSMVAAARYAADYDGIVAGNPGFNLPRARIAEEWDSQALMAAAQSTDAVTGRPAIWSALSAADMTYVNNQILAKCDALDGASDGMVSDVKACQGAFSLANDVATCAAGTAPNGICLTQVQKNTLAKIFAGPKDSAGKALYADWPFANGIGASGWRLWKMGVSNGTGNGIPKYGLNQVFAGSGVFIFSTPPADPTVVTGLGATLIDWTAAYEFNKAESLINGTTPVFTESSMSFMTPPNPTDLSRLRNRGAKLMVYHGTADPVFSYNDTTSWYTGLTNANNGDATNFARVFGVPGMNHCSGGPATDQFDMLTPLVAWVEQGQAPDSVIAKARTAAQNADLAAVAPGRTRPLCAYPKVARYKGSGSLEDAANFACQ
nr:tannase/feruloyl esterase family alpha/beta hydrolase [uncultured Albidiferax sp.]